MVVAQEPIEERTHETEMAPVTGHVSNMLSSATYPRAAKADEHAGAGHHDNTNPPRTMRKVLHICLVARTTYVANGTAIEMW